LESAAELGVGGRPWFKIDSTRVAKISTIRPASLLLCVAYAVEAAEEGQSAVVKALSSYSTAAIEQAAELLPDGGAIAISSVVDGVGMEVSVGFQPHKRGVRDVADVTAVACFLVLQRNRRE
jgi:hypothetical protein